MPGASTIPSTPTRPIRPTRAVRPSPSDHAHSQSNGSIPPLTPNTPTYSPLHDASSLPLPTTPQTPTPAPSSFPSRSHDTRRKSTASSISSRRKPVPLTSDDVALVLLPLGRQDGSRSLDTTNPFVDQHMPSPVVDTPFPGSSNPVSPPQYILAVAAPSTGLYAPAYSPDHDDAASSSLSRQLSITPAYIECGLPTPGNGRSMEQLPVYAEDVQTEPDTLARKCWLWGFLFPVLWIIGMAM